MPEQKIRNLTENMKGTIFNKGLTYEQAYLY